MSPRPSARPEQGQERARSGQPDVEQRDRAMVIPRKDQPLVEVGAVSGEDVLAVAAEEGEYGVEEEGPDQQDALYRAQVNQTRPR